MLETTGWQRGTIICQDTIGIQQSQFSKTLKYCASFYWFSRTFNALEKSFQNFRTFKYLQGLQCCTFFLAPYRTVSWSPNFNCTWCPDDAKTIGHQTWREKKSVVVNMKSYVHITNNQSWNSCQGVVYDHEVTFCSAFQPIKHDALWPCTIYGCSLQPKHGVPAIWMHLSTHQYSAWTRGLNLVGLSTSNCILIGPRPW